MAHDILVERDVMVAMRDGTRLAADIYRPRDDGAHPTLLNLHPYDNDSFLVVHELLFSPLIAAQKGYAVVSVEARGRAGSEGEWTPYGDEGRDAHDAVEWAAAQPWSNGNVGLYGACALGLAAIQGAVATPPHLKAVFAYMTATNFHSGWTYSEGGAFELGFQMSWVWKILARDTLSRRGLAAAELAAALARIDAAATDMNGSAAFLPLIDFPPYQDGAAPYWREWLAHPAYDAFWERVDNVAAAGRIQVPVMHLSAWYDTCLKGHLDLDAALRRAGDPALATRHRMVIGPTDHSAYYNKRPCHAGERDFGPAALTGPDVLAGMVFDWFGHHLCGEPLRELPHHGVRYWQLGENRWKEAPAWPPAYTPTPYYLHSGGGANTRFGDGTLDTRTPRVEAVDSFVYDPFDPVPTTGGRSMIDVPTGVYDQATVEERHDVLVYTSACLGGPLVLNGPAGVTLFAASDAEDTDFTAKLVDVEPGGYCANIAEGIIRARYREDRSREVFLVPGEATELRIDLWDIAHTFLPGHRIRLEISSSNFPRFDRNLNTRVTPALGSAADARKAVQQVFHDHTRPSRLELPVARSPD
ncbi:MAG: Cocaine esterase [Pseudomonadales bacterium]|nr:Cocaine esterase [Pseudomonadales bacterium]